MDIFPKIAKLILYSILAVTVYLFALDYGRGYVIDSQNSFMLRNSATYVTKFAVEEKELVEFKGKSLTYEKARDSLIEYFELQLTDVSEGMNYEYRGIQSESSKGVVLRFNPVGNQMSDGEYESLGPIFIRLKLIGFEGSLTSDSGYTKYTNEGLGLIIVNIEQKVPSRLRSLVKSTGNNNVQTDFEGFWGYLSVESTKAFTLNVLDKSY